MDQQKPIKGEWAIERTIRITNNLRVHITVGPGGMTSEWDPDMPKTLTPRQLNRYRRGRDQLIAEVGERLGVGSLIIEI
jgi:hypothetical protein